MTDTTMTLAEILKNIERYTAGWGPDMIPNPSGMAATVRAADELLGRTLSQVRCDMWKFTDADCGKCEPCELIADIRKIRGGTQ